MTGESIGGNEALPSQASEDQAAAFEGSSEDRDATLAAVHHLEAAVGMAGPGREDAWLLQVTADLRTVEGAVVAERDDAQRPDSLLSIIAQDYPRRFSSRVRQLHDQHEAIVTMIGSLRVELESMGDGIDVADLRQRLGALVYAIRDRWARETDLVYEAIRLDLGRSDPLRRSAE
jgi:hypothetical protein